MVLSKDKDSLIWEEDLVSVMVLGTWALIPIAESLVIKGLVNLNLGNENREQLERKEQREFEHVTSRVTTSYKKGARMRLGEIEKKISILFITNTTRFHIFITATSFPPKLTNH